MSPTIRTVTLKVAILENMVAFYQDIIGLQVHRRSGSTAYLGAGKDDLLALTETPEGKRIPNTTGLYHFALLVPSRYDLARSLQRLIDTRTQLQGLSDHFVSEAIYLADPEGNGIEIYRDRPRSDWFVNGQFQMGTERMDVRGVLGTLEGKTPEWEGLHPNTIMGHIHLHVSAIPETEAFYHDLLGMDVMFNWGSATFMSYDGYHHHVGANIWAGRVPPPEKGWGLDKFVLQVPSNHFSTIVEQLKQVNTPLKKIDEGYLVRDPSKNRILLVENSN